MSNVKFEATEIEGSLGDSAFVTRQPEDGKGDTMVCVRDTLIFRYKHQSHWETLLELMA